MLHFPEAVTQLRPELQVLPGTCVIVTLPFPESISAPPLPNSGRGRGQEPEFRVHLSKGVGPWRQAGLSEHRDETGIRTDHSLALEWNSRERAYYQKTNRGVAGISTESVCV